MKGRRIAGTWPSLRVPKAQRSTSRNKPPPAAPKPQWPHVEQDFSRKNFDEDPTRQHAKDYSPSVKQPAAVSLRQVR
jgi:hypothetical protein